MERLKELWGVAKFGLRIYLMKKYGFDIKEVLEKKENKDGGPAQ